MPRIIEIIEGVEYITEEYGTLKILIARKGTFRAERTYIGRFLAQEEIREGEKITIRKYRGGKLHADRSPAVYIRDNDFLGEYWFKHGLRHRLGGPAISETNGSRKYIAFYKDGVRQNV